MKALILILFSVLFLVRCQKKNITASGKINSSGYQENVLSLDQIRSKDKRKYLQLILPNKLNVFLISDPDATKSAASLNVQIGSFANPKEYLGIAHFLEHMLFLGTKKYPETGSYQKFISNNGGQSNAYTDYVSTNYHFEINHEALEGALDRFGQFFISPTFNPEFVKREKNAVNSEHEKNIQNSFRRKMTLLNSISKKDHPLGLFKIGTNETLAPVSRQILLDFYHKHYSANIMSLVIYSNKDPQILEKWTRRIFSEIKNTNTQAPIYETPYSDPNDLPVLLSMKALTDRKELTLSFELPSKMKHQKSKPYEFLNFFINNSGEGSFISLLRKENLATTLYSGDLSDAFSTNLLIDISLTDYGIKNTDKILEHFFSYIKMIQKEGLKKHIFQDEKSMGEISLGFKDHLEGMDAAIHYSSMMTYFPASDIDSTLYLYQEFAPQDFHYFLSFINPHNLKSLITSPAVKTSLKEKYSQIEYNREKIKTSLITQLENIKINPYFQYPLKNKFIPENFTILHSEGQDSPRKIIDDEKGILWFMQDREVKLPKAKVKILILSDIIQASPLNWAKSWLYEYALWRSLKEWQFPIINAGLSYNLSTNYRGLELTVEGHSDKIPVLVVEFMKRLKNITLSEEEFEALKQEQIRTFKQFEIGPAYKQAKYHMSNFFTPKEIHQDEFKDLIKDISLKDINKFIQNVYREVAIEGVAYGNLEDKKLKQMVADLYSHLNAKILPKKRWPKEDELKIEPGASVIFERNTLNNNNVWDGVFQLGQRSPKLNAMIRIIETYIGDKFYHEMRTKRQLGYVVGSSRYYGKKSLALLFLIQSSNVAPEILHQQAMQWLRDEFKRMENLKESEFVKIKDGIIQTLKRKDKTIDEWFSHITFGGLYLDGVFNYREKLIEELKKIQLNEVVSMIQNALNPKNMAHAVLFLRAPGFKPVKSKKLGAKILKNPLEYKKQATTY